MRRLIVALLFFSLAFQLYAQDKQDCYVIVKNDTVYLFLKENLKVGQGFYVERRGASDEKFARLFEQPVTPVLNPIVFADMLGNDYHFILNSLKVQSPQQMLLRLRTDRFASMVYTMLFHNAGEALGRFYKTVGNIPGETYNYRVVIVDKRGKVVQTIEKEVLIADRLPHTPDTVNCFQEYRSVVIEWNYPRWQAGGRDMTVQYYIYRKSAGADYRKINDKILLRLDNISNQYIDATVEIGTQYSYRMTAVDASGKESEFSPEVNVHVKDIIPPARPVNLAAIPSEDRVELIWNMSPELDVTAYNIYRWMGVEKDSIIVNDEYISPDQPYFIDSTCVTGRQYYYAVSALDTAGNESRHSNRAAAFPVDRTPPASPGELTAAVDGNTVRLFWKAPEDKDVLGYRITRGLSENRHNQVFLTSDPVPGTTYIDKGEPEHRLIPGQRYCYSVTALDTLWHQSEQAFVWIALPDNEPPSSPGAVIIGNDRGIALTIKWNSSPSLDISGYLVYRGSGTQIDSIGYVPSKNRKFRDTYLSKGKEYFYHIIALDTSGNRSTAAVSNKVVFRDFTAPPVVQYVSVKKEGDGIRIDWERVVDFDLTEYRIYRSSSPTGIFKNIAAVPIEKLQYFDQQGKNDLWYSIRAVDSSGNESKGSRPVKANM